MPLVRLLLSARSRAPLFSPQLSRRGLGSFRPRSHSKWFKFKKLAPHESCRRTTRRRSVLPPHVLCTRISFLVASLLRRGLGRSPVLLCCSTTPGEVTIAQVLYSTLAASDAVAPGLPRTRRLTNPRAVFRWLGFAAQSMLEVHLPP